jgi:hypothetical protein
MADLLKAPIGGIPVGVYALIGLTTGILAYTTLADETAGSNPADNTASLLPAMDPFSGDKGEEPAQSGGRRKKHKRKTPHRKGGAGTKKKK